MTDTPSPRPTSARDGLVEAPADEFRRLVAEYHSASELGSVKEEAWNLIADFAVDNASLIADRLSSLREEVRGARSSIEYHQMRGAPLTFYAHEADAWWRAEATRDDVSTRDCMYAALQHLDELLSQRSSLEATPETAEVGEAKPVAWLWEVRTSFKVTKDGGRDWNWKKLLTFVRPYADGENPASIEEIRNVTPLYPAPVPTFSITDEAVERALDAWFGHPEDRRYADSDRRDMRLTLDAALSAASSISNTGGEKDGWQPIETAPKDGTEVDLWVEPVSDAPAEFRAQNWPRRVANTYYSNYHWLAAEWPWEPTHWRPLPTPPIEESKE